MSYRDIVIGVDFSTASLNAVRWVAASFAPRARLHLVHVVAQPRIPSFLRSHVTGDGDGEADEPTLYPGLAGFAGFAGARRAEVSVRFGEPADQLAAIARDVNADLICVGRSRRRRGTGRFGATTPQRLLARTRRSVLLVPSAPRLQPARLLAAVSDGAEAENVLRAAEERAAAWDAHVDVLHALSPAIPPLRTAASALRASAAEPEREDFTYAADIAGEPHAPDLHQLTEAWLAHRAADMPVLRSRMTAVGRTGDAAETILTHAGRASSDLIVLGRRTVAEPGEEFEGCVGSITRLITWTTPCPVLVVGARSLDRASRQWSATRRVSTPDRARAASEHGFRRRRSDMADPFDGGDAA
jgi:nucleotide-binding universal stress UspA family protein